MPGGTVRVAAFGVCVSGGQVLLSRFADGRWSLPGGGVAFGEHPFDGVVREVREETGYLVRVDALLGVLSWVWTGTSTHQVSFVYEVTAVDGRLANEVDGTTVEAAWVPLESVGSLPQIEIVRTCLELLDRRPVDGR